MQRNKKDTEKNIIMHFPMFFILLSYERKQKQDKENRIKNFQNMLYTIYIEC